MKLYGDGKWISDNQLPPETNIFARPWRDGTGKSGVFVGAGSYPVSDLGADKATLQWFFPSQHS